jgi:TnpA family transposase
MTFIFVLLTEIFCKAEDLGRKARLRRIDPTAD